MYTVTLIRYREYVVGEKYLSMFNYDICTLQDLDYNIYWKDLSTTPSPCFYKDLFIQRGVQYYYNNQHPPGGTWADWISASGCDTHS